jgi:hypothetical protein
MHFPANAGLIVIMDELTNDRYLVDTGATLNIFPCNQIPAHLFPFSKWQMGSQSPLGASLKKLCKLKANFSHPVFYKLLWPVPY